MVSYNSCGHKVIYINDVQLYADDLSPASVLRPCKRCGQFPTKEGYDHCLGHIPNAISACCGHGVEKPYLMLSAPQALNPRGNQRSLGLDPQWGPEGGKK